MTNTAVRVHLYKTGTLLIQYFSPHSDYLDEDGVPSDFIKFFYKPWNHANVFFIGFIFGSYIQSNNNLGQYSLKKVW